MLILLKQESEHTEQTDDRHQTMEGIKELELNMIKGESLHSHNHHYYFWDLQVSIFKLLSGLALPFILYKNGT